MPAVTLRQLLEAGVHFGHQTSRWNPKMRPFIFAARNGIHIIDLEKTLEQLARAAASLRDGRADGEKVLFVGTKRRPQDIIAGEADRSGMHYVINRWLGGMLTNFRPIKQRLATASKELERMEEDGTFEECRRRTVTPQTRSRAVSRSTSSGIKNMNALPGAVMFVDRSKKERIAVTEANKLGIPIVAIVDTNCDPGPHPVVIPGNDDAMRSCRLIVTAIGQAITEGLQQLSERELLERQEAEKREREAAAAAEVAAALAAEAAAADAAHADAVAAEAAAEAPAEAAAEVPVAAAAAPVAEEKA